MKLSKPIISKDFLGNPINLTEVEIIIMDSYEKKMVLAKLYPCPKPLILWQGEEYDQIGDYTQAQMDSRLKELLGDNPEEVIQSLFDVFLKN